MLLLWIAALSYRKRYVPVEQDKPKPAWVEDDDDWLMLHITGQWW